MKTYDQYFDEAREKLRAIYRETGNVETVIKGAAEIIATFMWGHQQVSSRIQHIKEGCTYQKNS